MDPADNTRQDIDRGPRARSPSSSLLQVARGGFLEHGRPEQGDRLVKERIQVGRGRAHTAAVR